jgi:hypothetical protein
MSTILAHRSLAQIEPVESTRANLRHAVSAPRYELFPRESN